MLKKYFFGLIMFFLVGVVYGHSVESEKLNELLSNTSEDSNRDNCAETSNHKIKLKSQSTKPTIETLKPGTKVEINNRIVCVLTYNQNTKTGIAIIHSPIDILRFTTNKQYLKQIPDFNSSDGKENTDGIINFITDNNFDLSNFPVFKKLKSMGEGWYIPSIDELCLAMKILAIIDWDKEDDLRYMAEGGNGGFLPYGTPQLDLSEILTSTIIDSKVKTIKFNTPNDYVTGKSKAYRVYPFCKFTINEVKFLEDSNNDKKEEDSQNENVTNQQQNSESENSQNLVQNKAISNDDTKVEDSKNTLNPNQIQQVEDDQQSSTFAWKADYSVERIVPEKFKLEDNIIIKNSTPYIIDKVIVFQDGSQVSSGNNIRPKKDETIKKYSSKELAKFKGVKLTIEIKSSRAKSADAKLDVSYSEDRDDLIIEIISSN